MFAPLMLGNFAFNNDQWDGYQADRNRITPVMQNGIDNVVIVTGDIHTSWANDVPQAGASYAPFTGYGSAFVEFITPSISTGTSLDNNIINVINAARHVKYVELTKSGYFILDIDTQRTQAEWYHVSTVKDAVFTVEEAAFWYVRRGERFLRQASAPTPVGKCSH